ncbi:MAG TPA: PhoPQ-activated protein PqaA family protein, partial [Gammaproteobacteria bacterium]|nr:PhoPQ-activated protein PqaA family protein [Gammaproteobacteria bacterium]
GVLLAGLTGLCAPAAQAQEQPEPGEALAAYVAKPDSSYAWRVFARYRQSGAAVLELRLYSQTWRDVLWKHQLLIIKPRNVVAGSHGLIILGGGRWRESYETEPPASALPDGAERFVAIARRLRTVVAVLGQVPYQPLFDRTEDRIIAYTFDQYLRTGDTEWPLLLPMVKSAVRAMDATQEVVRQEWGVPLQTFTVLGGSKRGWTGWLTAAADPRVTALAPIVIDALNMRLHFVHQIAVWGAPSEEILPYTELNLPNVLSSDAGRGLREIVDPFSYRARLTQPKLIVIATNDRYFPPDSANLYWDDLSGPKYLLYLPNDQHSIEDFGRLLPSLDALHRHAAAGDPLPELDWEYRRDGAALMLCLRSKPAPSKVRVWTAGSASADFRDSRWIEAAVQRTEGVYVFELLRPLGGYAAVFAEAVFGRRRSAYSLSTNLSVLGTSTATDVGPQANGHHAVCAAADGARAVERLDSPGAIAENTATASGRAGRSEVQSEQKNFLD